MADAWNDIQALKNRQSSMRAKMMERRKQREGLAAELTSSGAAPSIVPVTTVSSSNANAEPPTATQQTNSSQIVKQPISTPVESSIKPTVLEKQDFAPIIDPDVEKKMLMVLCDTSLDIPSDSRVIAEHTSRFMEREVDIKMVEDLLRKFATEKLISIKTSEATSGLIVNSLDFTKLSAVTRGKKRPRDSEDEGEEDGINKQSKTSTGPESGDIESLLSMQSIKEREEKKINEEIQALLVTQTAKEQYLVEKFKSRGGPQLQEFCQYGTREECYRTCPDSANCKRLHFKKIIHKHTDESLGDCSFLNTCFHMDTCKDPSNIPVSTESTMSTPEGEALYENQNNHEGTVQQSSSDWFYPYDTQALFDPRQTVLNRPHVPQHPPVVDTNLSNNYTGMYFPVIVANGTSSENPSQMSTPNQTHSNHQTKVPKISQQSSDSQLKAKATVVKGNHSNNQSSMYQPHDCQRKEELESFIGLNATFGYGQQTTSASGALNLSQIINSTLLPSAQTYAQPVVLPFSLTAPPPGSITCAASTSSSSEDLLYDSLVPINHLWNFGGSTSNGCPSSSAARPMSSSSPPTAESKSVSVQNNYSSVKKKTKKLKDSSSNFQIGAKTKRIKQPDKWKKNVNKRAKLCGEEHVSRTGHLIPAKRVEYVDCSQCSFSCCKNFNQDLRQQIFDVFYSLGSNESQKQFVCQNVVEAPTKEIHVGRVKTLSLNNEMEVKGNVQGNGKTKHVHSENKRKVTRKYFLPESDNTKKQVCVKFFCRTLAIGTTFISHALKHKQFGCYMGKEKRGKPHNKIPEHLLEPARRHIQTVLFGSDSSVNDPYVSKRAVKKKFTEHGLNYVHYEIDYPRLPSTELLRKESSLGKALSSEIGDDGSVQMFPPQWIQCDLRYFDMSTLGKCAVVMADPPWDIHMELPYGTMGDNEMRRLNIPGLQDEGFIFLWVTGRAMELGRECLELWGYKRVDEIIWVKTNQLQRIIRTGRTGHWINHGKEHCLVGVKGNPKGVNRGMDCDVIVAEVRATSHKPDEIYGIIERLSPGTRKVELFGRPHNVQPNWITLGNQLEGVHLKDPDIVKLFREKYPDGNCMGPSQSQKR
ncbi:N6-adenosine-methyltransferase subunit [Elysia marginata]|uniref:mRNA m(6)A methyltransferase n=1 Tax=Elysia marginata TaxID=1093978 RepID=A0AAV4EGC4_9GAST|nr:N6-adenosine-methyltransferase subunit [Elysia marginata]